MANPETIEGSWGIDPVPSRLHVLSGLETGLLWGNLGVSLLVIVAGAILVPALSLPAALVAIVVGCVIGNAMLAVAGMIGADARVPGMALMRAPLGQRGSLLPTGINVLQGIGWTIFELLVIATAAAALSDELFGFRAQWLWTLVFGACALVLALLGPIGFVRRFIRRFAIWAVPLALLYLTWWAIDGADWSTIWNTDGEGGLSVWQGADVVVGITVSWVPYAADYTRFSRSRRGALAGTGLGYFVPDVWLLALGAVLVLSRGLGDPAALPAAVVAGGFAAIVALFALLVTETDEAFANAYSAAVSLQNAVPHAPQKLLIVIVTGIATVGALIVDFVSYQSFLLLLGSVFVPLFAVLLADWLAAGAHYTADDIFDSPPWRPGLIAAWIAGFALYQWLFPTGPAWWVDLVGRLNPPDWGIGATVPSFLVSFAIASVVALVARRVTAGSCASMSSIAALGHITRDVVDGAPPRPGGGVFYAARALARLGADAHVEAACSSRASRRARSGARGLRASDELARIVHDDRSTASTTRATGGSCGRTRSAIRGLLPRRSLRPVTRSGSTSAPSHAPTFPPRPSPRSPRTDVSSSSISRASSAPRRSGRCTRTSTSATFSATSRS